MKGGTVSKPSFEVVYQQNYLKVLHYCLRMTNDLDKAEDYTQTAFLKAFKNYHRFRGDSAVATWLTRIVVNEVLGDKRKLYTKLEEQLELREDGEPTHSYSARDRVTESIPERLIVKNALNMLSRNSRKKSMSAVFKLNQIHGYSHKELAKILRVSVNTIKSDCYRASHKMKQYLTT